MDKNELSQIQLQKPLDGDLEKKLKEEDKKKNAIRHLSRVPGNCPVGKCREIVFPPNMMMHMLHKHANQSLSTVTSEVFDYKPIVVCFDPTGYQYGVNHCLATLMYGGVRDEPSTRPGCSYLSMPNSALMNDHHKYDNHLPIMMLVCRSTWYAQLKDKILERELVTNNGSKAGVFVFWLAAPTTTRKLYYTLTVFDRYYLNSRSVMRVVRDYTSSQNPSDFLPYDDDYLLLREAEVSEYANVNKGKHNMLGIPIEVIVHEKPFKHPVQHCSTRELQEALENTQTSPSNLHIEKSKKMSTASSKKPKKKSTNLAMK